MKKLLLFALCLGPVSVLPAQNIDFDLPGKTTPGKDTEINYISWAVPRATSDTKTFENGVTITISAGGAASAVGSNWNKTDVETNGLRVIADEVLATNLEDGNLTYITDASTSLILTVTGLSAGQHSLKAYHNNSDANQTQPDIEVKVDGNVVASGIKFSSAAKSTIEAGSSFITFNATEGQPVVITYSTVLEAGKTYTNTRAMLNGLEFDVAAMVATDPIPENHDFHAGSEDGTISFSWVAAPDAVSHKLVLGTDSLKVANATTYEYQGNDTSYVKSGLSSKIQYWWRVDEVDSEGNVHQGKTWTCQPCHLAFPEAEGYGRYARGGRGGIVYHVTNLSGDKDVEGSLLYGLVNIDEPRYIVFDVSGIIELDFSSNFVKPYAYIAGQTAPGKGICIKASNINIGSDIICRHVRFKRGLGVYGENTGNAMGMSGANHSIVDHCTAAWGTDETVSGRGALNISFQYSGIFEALGIAGHKNYADGTNHGYAATIDGRIGSWHHNLLLNCEGRNWSMGGGMDGQNRPIGGLDLFNNVCYNWYGRTTDGNCHAVNFVNNYYKMGTDTKKTILFTQDFEGAINPEGTNQAFVAGNIRENKNHTLTIQQSPLDKKNDIFNAVASKDGAIPTTYDYQVSEPLFPSYADIHTAQDAMKIVTSYAGATMPMRDEQHLRVVKETIDGTWTYKGSKSGIKGEIDNEADLTGVDNQGWEIWPEQAREADFDTDGDGMPDWWEEAVNSDPKTANQNDDPDDDGWTLLEDYLDFMAHPYLTIAPNGSGTLDLKEYFAGFFGQNGKSVTPVFSLDEKTAEGLHTESIEGTTLTVRAAQSNTKGVGSFYVCVNDGETTWKQRFGVAITGTPSAIHNVWSEDELEVAKREFFTLDGKPVRTLQSGEIYLMRITEKTGKQQTVKVWAN
ncbi:MAG: hypothetical protein IJP70_00860 [Bacteroidales bacterium]|nr:hypothetical protein [Bacteroidales bacterium]